MVSGCCPVVDRCADDDDGRPRAGIGRALPSAADNGVPGDVAIALAGERPSGRADELERARREIEELRARLSQLSS